MLKELMQVIGIALLLVFPFIFIASGISFVWLGIFGNPLAAIAIKVCFAALISCMIEVALIAFTNVQ